MTHRQVSLSPLASSFVTSFFFSHSIVFIIFTDILGVHINYDVDSITYDDFINRELILFSHAGNSDFLSPLSSHCVFSSSSLCPVYLYVLNKSLPLSHSPHLKHPLSLSLSLDNERSLPHFMDGLKPSQRKVLFACFKRNLKQEIKVAQLAGKIF